MKNFLRTYRHAWIMISYFPVYLSLFFLVESLVTDSYHVIECGLDRLIPFNEWFIFPYLLWFPYIAVGIIAFIFLDKKEYYKLSKMLIVGMSIFLLISFLYPNGLNIRPNLADIPGKNIALTLLSGLHKADTPTNVFPSIHVYNSLAVCFSFFHSKQFKGNAAIKASVLILTVLICLSTVFLKQHSVIDVAGAMLLFLLLLPAVYRKTKTSV